MKVGTDGVLLGAWAEVRSDDRRILDIGTGTGVIALMLAQRSAAHITALDILPECTARAAANFTASPWGDRLESLCTPVQAFATEERFDLIVSNPPFFTESLLPPDAGRTLARHTASLPFPELVAAVLRLLAPGGRFALVLPVPEMQAFRSAALGRLYLRRMTEVCSTPKRGVRRVLAEFAAEPQQPASVDRLVIQSCGEGTYTDEYRRLTGDFYLAF